MTLFICKNCKKPCRLRVPGRNQETVMPDRCPFGYNAATEKAPWWKVVE